MTDSDRLSELLYQATRLSGRERDLFLDDVAQQDSELGEELRSLVEHAGVADEKLVGSSLLRSDAAAGTLPEQIGPYTVIRRIGQGGMGEVFEAIQPAPIRRHVAVKTVKPGMDSEAVLRRFRNERRTLAELDHAHISRAVDAGKDEAGRPYIVMELADGPPITEYARLHGLDVRERVELLLQACLGIEHAHAHGLLHRDLKPANILVTQQAGRPHVTVIDFGMAALLEPADVGMSFEFTHTGERRGPVGTIEYMSPEQVESKPLDERSDVYALGIVLYELLADRAPFERERLRRLPPDSLSRFLREQVPSAPSRTRSEGGTTPPGARGRELDWICLRAMDPVPGRRYATVAALRQDLERHRAGEPVTAAPPSGWYRLQKYVARHRLLVGVSAAAVLVSAAVAAIATGAYLRVSEAQRDTADALAEVEAATEYLGDIITMSSPFELGPEVTVRHLLDHSLAELDTKGIPPRVRERLRPIFGSAYLSLGELEKAEAVFARSEREAPGVLGEESPAYASLLVRQSSLSLRTGQHDHAAELALRAIDILEIEEKEPNERVLEAKVAFATAMIGGVNVAAGLEDARDAVDYAREHGLAAGPAGVSARIVLANGLWKNGETEASLTTLADLRASVLEGGDVEQDWPTRTYVLREYAAALLRSKRLEQAIEAYDEAISVWTAHMTSSRQAELKLRFERAIARASSGAYDEAADEAAPLIEDYAREVGPLATSTLAIRANYLNMLLGAKRFAEVVDQAGDLIRSLERNGQGDTITCAHAYSLRGDAHSYLEQELEAADNYEVAIRIYESRGAQHLPAYRWVVGNHMATMRTLGRADEAEASRVKYESTNPDS